MPVSATPTYNVVVADSDLVYFTMSTTHGQLLPGGSELLRNPRVQAGYSNMFVYDCSQMMQHCIASHADDQV